MVLEKVSFLALPAVAGAATLAAQSGAIQTFERIPLPLRVGNALISCQTYVGQVFWPSGLAAFHPFPANGRLPWEIIPAAVLLLAISAGVLVWRKSCPYLLTGWLWYLIMLAPVAGILQVGSQARADRYTELKLYQAGKPFHTQ